MCSAQIKTFSVVLLALLLDLNPQLASVFQVIASVLRNLSWRADVNSKKTLREVGSVRALMGCALEVQKVNEKFVCELDLSHGSVLSAL